MRAFVPELEALPDVFIQEPRLWPGAAVLPYPPPIVDHAQAARAARDALYAVRQGADHKREANEIFAKHGSRKADLPMKTGSGAVR